MGKYPWVQINNNSKNKYIYLEEKTFYCPGLDNTVHNIKASTEAVKKNK